MAISMLKIRRPLGRLIFNMGIAIPGKIVFLIETAPCFIGFQSIRARLNIKTIFPNCGDLHVKYKTVARPTYL